LKDIMPVGYHAWTDDRKVVLFVLADEEKDIPITMQSADVVTGEAEIITTHIGRSLHKIPGRHAVSFVHKAPGEKWIIKEFDADTKKISEIAPVIDGHEDYCWVSGDLLLLGSGSKLYVYDTRGGSEWKEVADFTEYSLKNITRLAISPRGDRLTIVAEK